MSLHAGGTATVLSKGDGRSGLCPLNNQIAYRAGHGGCSLHGPCPHGLGPECNPRWIRENHLGTRGLRMG